jgi:hypothetical protein
MTCTSIDPLVATLFAIYARQFGQGVVLLGERAGLEASCGPSNFGNELELAVNLRLRPVEFERRARWAVPVSESVEILAELGFSRLPIGLVTPSDLRRALEWTQADESRLNGDQIIDYNRRAEELCHAD